VPFDRDAPCGPGSGTATFICFFKPELGDLTQRDLLIASEIETKKAGPVLPPGFSKKERRVVARPESGGEFGVTIS